MGNGKPTRCPICREMLSSGKALGGHMSRHKAARQRRAATLAATLAAKASPARVSRKKTRNCTICGERMGSGRAIGGHMAKHAKAGRLEAAMASRVTYPQRAQATLTPDHKTAYAAATSKNTGVTMDFGSAMNKTLRIVEGLRAASKEKRTVAAKLEAQAKQGREDANEIDRLAERIEHLL